MIRWFRRILFISFCFSMVFWLINVAKLGMLFGILVNPFDPIKIANYRLNLITPQQFEDTIIEEINAENYSLAEEIIVLAEEQGIVIPDNVKENAAATLLKKSLTQGKRFAWGAVSGDSETGAAFAGSTISDFFVIGDLRDVAIQGYSMAKGEPYDKIVLTLSAVGIVTIAGGPVDSGLSIIKAAKKSSKIGDNLIRSLHKMTSKIVDKEKLLGAIKSVDSKNLADVTALRKIELKSILKKIADSVQLKQTKQIIAVANDTGTIAKKGGLKSASMALEYAENAKQIKKLAIISNTFGARTQALFKLTGKSLLKVWDIGVLLSTLLLPLLISFAMFTLLLFNLIFNAVFKRLGRNVNAVN